MGLFGSLFGKKITVQLPDEQGRIVERKITKKMFDKLVTQGIIQEIDAVQAHILDPLKGYYVSNWRLGEDIDRETADKFATENKQLYVAIAYEEGEPQTMVMKKEVWEKQKILFERIDSGKDYESEMRLFLDDLEDTAKKENSD